MRTFLATNRGAVEYEDRVDIHAPHWHQGRRICMKCSLDMSLPVHPVQWPCEADLLVLAECPAVVA